MTPGTSILVADDEVEFLESLARVLGRRGFEVVTACSGAGAVEAASTGSFDVIILDVRMPGMDGLEALEAIKRISPLTPVLLLTGHADIAIASAALRSGASDFMVKPCPVDDLVTAIENAAEHRALARAAAPDPARERG